MTHRKTIIGVVVLAALAGGVFAAFAARGDQQAQTRSDAIPPATVTHDENEWSIVTPAGWTARDHTAKTDAEKAVRYEGPNGEYVIVAIDPLGSDYAVDTLWTYKTKGDRFEIVAKQDCTGTAEQGCSSNDDRFDGYALWKSGTAPEQVGGHVYYFMFGSTAKDSIDAAAFEQILESVRVNG